VIRPLLAQKDNQFLRFLISGGIAAAVNVGSRFVLDFFMGYGAAITIAFLLGMTTAWVLTRVFVFERTGRRKSTEYFRFAVVNLFALAQVYGISIGLADYLFPFVGFGFYPNDVAHVIGVATPAITSYFAHKHYSFSHVKPTGEAL
jgi:putative flippase GtrA